MIGWSDQQKTNICLFNKNKSLNQKLELFDLLRLVLLMSVQNLTSFFKIPEEEIKFRLEIRDPQYLNLELSKTFQAILLSPLMCSYWPICHFLSKNARTTQIRMLSVPPCIMCVQYIGGCPVHRGDTMSTSRGIPWVHRGDIMSTSGDIQYNGGISWWMWGDTMSTSGDVQYIRGMFSTSEGCSVHRRDTMSTSGGYHEYIGGCSVHRRVIMINVGEQLDKILSISIENSNVLNIPQCTHDIPRCTHGIPPMYWTPPDVLNIPRCTEHTLYRVVRPSI